MRERGREREREREERERETWLMLELSRLQGREKKERLKIKRIKHLLAQQQQQQILDYLNWYGPGLILAQEKGADGWGHISSDTATGQGRRVNYVAATTKKSTGRCELTAQCPLNPKYLTVSSVTVGGGGGGGGLSLNKHRNVKLYQSLEQIVKRLDDY